MKSDNLPAAFLKERLRLSAVKPDAARYAGIRAMTVLEARAAGYAVPGWPSDGFLLSYYDAKGKLIPQMWRWRNSEGKKDFKYLQPAGTGCWVYFPRVEGLNWAKVLADPRIPVFIVEGELKALSLCLAGVLAVAIGGTDNYLTHKDLLPELRELAKGGRALYIAFDSDTEDNVGVQRARYSLAKHLLDQRADVHWLTLPHIADPDSPKKTGMDDLVRVWKLADEKLSERLKTLEAKDGFAIQQHLLRMNTEYVLNLQNARVYKVANPSQSWEDLKFARVIENAPVVVGQKVGNGGKLEDVVAKLGRAWIDWTPSRNVVEGRIYEPRGQDELDSPYIMLDGKRYLNNWTGWASEPAPDLEHPKNVAKYWTALLDHLFRAKSLETAQQKKERDRARRWFEMWAAYPVQHPGEKLYSAAAFTGAQGGGKGLVGYILQWAVYGAHWKEISQDELDSRFNAGWAANCSFVLGSEVTSLTNWQLQRKVSEILKNWITGETIRVEPKGVDTYDVRNTLNFLFTSNPSDAFFLEGDDRRYFIWEIPDVKLVDVFGQEWIDALVEYFKSPVGGAALHYHLLHLEIDPGLFNPKASPPDTEAKRNAKEYSQNAAEHWLAKFEATPEEFTHRPRGQEVFRLEEVYDAFLRATDSNKGKWPERAFTLVFRKRFQYLGRTFVKVVKGNKHWNPDTECWEANFERRKAGLWIRKPSYNGNKPCPTLAEARASWDKALADWLS